MGLLEQQLAQGLLSPATANQNMLAQALKARQTNPRTQLNGQGLLDTAAIGLSPVPVIGDLLGLGADANRFINEPESRTPLNFGLAALGLIPFVPPLVSAGLGKFAQSQGKTLSAPSMTGPGKNQAGAIVYHGSPHKFDQFDSSKIGTGEGAQAYGHGLYFAENPSIAKHYKEKLSEGNDARPFITEIINSLHGQKKPINKQSLSDEFLRYPQTKDFVADDNVLSLSQRAADGYEIKSDTWTSEGLKALQQLDKTLPPAPKGSLYKVDLPDEAIAKMLDWDKPLSQQSPEVQKAFGSVDPNGRINTGLAYQRWRDSQSVDPVSAAEKLKNMGIPGVRYLDGGSRGAGDGTRNFVVFPGNEGILKILDRQ